MAFPDRLFQQEISKELEKANIRYIEDAALSWWSSNYQCKQGHWLTKGTLAYGEFNTTVNTIDWIFGIIMRYCPTFFPLKTDSFVLIGLMFAGPVHWTEHMTETELNLTAKDQTAGCSCTYSDFFWLPVVMFVEKMERLKKLVNRLKPVYHPIKCWTLLMHIFA